MSLGILDYKGCLLKRTANIVMLKVEGVSSTVAYNHIRGVNVENVSFDGDIHAEDMIQLISTSYFKFENCAIFYGAGRQILFWECWDSRFLNVDFIYGGSTDGVTSGIEFRSTDGDLGGATLENTNNIYFDGCRFEWYYNAIESTGFNTNMIMFNNCKFESENCTVNPHMKFSKARTINFSNVVFVTKKIVPNVLEFYQTEGVNGDVSITYALDSVDVDGATIKAEDPTGFNLRLI
ncbi:unnamed protein product [marine sediment metagenome]|uniref:Right handed beta helix domain-containing protein n=1 Tax=marine sediment metagenome TaxID=412755 RepID=X1DNZ1_9ZZZZ